MSAHDIGVTVDEWQAARLAIRERIANHVQTLAIEGADSSEILPGELALAIADLEAMDRLSNGHPLVPVEMRDPASD